MNTAETHPLLRIWKIRSTLFPGSCAQLKSRPGPLACEALIRIKEAALRGKQEGPLATVRHPPQPLDIPYKMAPLPAFGQAIGELWGLSGADHIAIGLPQRDALVLWQIHRIGRPDVEGVRERGLVAQGAVGAELPR